MSRPLARRLILVALSLSTATLAACSATTAPVANEGCGGVYTGVGTRCADSGDSVRTGN